MPDRRLLAAVGLVALVLTSGCLGAFLGGGSLSDERLNEEPPEPYRWDADVDAHITVRADATFQGVYRVDRGSVELFRRDGFGGRNPLEVRAVRFRYPNGTVITGAEFEERGGSIERTRNAVVVDLPAKRGRLAFTAGSTPKRFSLPTFVEGSYEVVLPPGRRIDFFLFGTVSPAADSRELTDDRVHLRWTDLTADGLLVQFYLQRDLQIFAGGVLGLVVIGLGGVLYYKRQIAVLREQREEMGLDVDTGDDEFDDDPPPGMR